MGNGGQVFVLDMGEPVRIMELAHQMIRLSGKEPERDIAIDIIGARPGEKLHEELWTQGEEVSPSEHPAILRVSRHSVDGAWLDAELRELERLIAEGDTLELVGRLAAVVREPQRADGGAVGATQAAPTVDTV
jgi:FlaA1/EpsC-like NDP-sugar epimerase